MPIYVLVCQNKLKIMHNLRYSIISCIYTILCFTDCHVINIVLIASWYLLEILGSMLHVFYIHYISIFLHIFFHNLRFVIYHERDDPCIAEALITTQANEWSWTQSLLKDKRWPKIYLIHKGIKLAITVNYRSDVEFYFNFLYKCM